MYNLRLGSCAPDPQPYDGSQRFAVVQRQGCRIPLWASYVQAQMQGLAPIEFLSGRDRTGYLEPTRLIQSELLEFRIPADKVELQGSP